jgi:hypothetical protein
MVTSVSSGILVNSGHLLENLVFIALRRVHQSIYYYRTRNGKEVDFVLPVKGRSHQLIQVCETMVDPLTRKREINSLKEAMNEMGLNEGTIVTRNEEAQITVDCGVISLIPVWRFLLCIK